MRKQTFATSPKEAVDSALKLLTTPYKEHFIGLYLDTRNRVIYKELISMGTLNTCLVHPREVFYPAVKKHICSVIVLHNHPSGNTEPSEADLETHKRLVEAGRILGIELLDSIVFTTDGKFHSLEGQ